MTERTTLEGAAKLQKPFLRWAGGKRWLAARLRPILAERLKTGTYFEPFLGSGAMFFALEPDRAVLSDINPELIITFTEIARNAEAIRSKLQTLKSTKEEFYRIRRTRPRLPMNKAVRLIYLNRNCWGGLYRENKRGLFNVPFGGGDRNHLSLVNSEELIEAGKALRRRRVRISEADFEKILLQARSGDIVYCDPTYSLVTRDHFDRYGGVIFDWHDQERLAKASLSAFRRGALVLVSNVSSAAIFTLYRGARILLTKRRKGLGTNGNATARNEYLVILDPEGRWEDWGILGSAIVNPAKRTEARKNLQFHRPFEQI